MQELLTFTEVLRGKRIALHARLDSVFAKHLTGYLTSWGCDIDHIPLDQLSEGHKSPHTAIALTEGRPSLVALPSDPGRGGVARSLTPNSAVLDPISGVPITVQSPGGTGSTPFSPEAARENGESSDNAGSAAPAEDAAGDVDGNLKIVPFSFVIIDDDAGTLQRELLRMRSAVPLLRSALSGSQSRPAFKHRPRSSPQISRVLASEGRLSTTPDGAGSTEGEAEGSNSSTGSSTYAIIHMTSLSNYRHIRDVVQSVITSASGTSPLPEVIVIPKPAGPRRILTALHTALHKPVIDPFFQPIATSPMSPGHYFFPGPGNGTLALDQSPSEQAPSIQGAIAPAVAPTQQPVPPTRRELSRFAAVSDRQTTTDRSSSATTTTQASSIPTKHASSSTVNHSAPSSPMPVDALEYFSETAARMGSSAASGMVIQSPDGRPAGIFFQPQPKTPSVHRRESAGILERSSPHGSTRRSVGDGSSHGSAPSIASGSRSVLGTKGPRRNTTSSKVYPSGSIFAPQVGIESILAGGHQPVATPLGQPQIPNASTSPWDIEARSPAATSSRVPSLAPSPVQPSRASNDHPHPRSASLSQGTSTNNVERVPASPARRSASQSDAATRASNNVPPPAQQVEVLASPPLQQREASPEASVSRGARSPVAAARHSFAMVQQPSRRPSAQPQAGLLIGAGFTPAAKKGGGPKKPPVREVVLPPINVLIVEGK